MCTEDLLHVLECRCIDERFVLAWVFNAFPADVAQVVAVAQDVVQLVRRERSRGSLRGRALAQSPSFKYVGEVVQAPITGGVLLEGPHDVWCAFWIGTHGADFVAVDGLANVEVADRCDGGRAAVLRFLSRTFGDFVGEVSAVELGNA
ncbi:hypothetical protein H7J84_14380 [Mycobacterium goodii]|nr:hypothetical protein [Mycolicibacterium wolinskyi]MCV7293718.1 hypothetical protein [Mycolicibacterium goodii]